MWNDSKSFLTTILPETLSLHMHEGTSDTAHPVSKYREKHSSIFPASEKASYLAVKCSHFLCETATYIYHTSMQIPCSTQFTFLSDTKYGCTVRKMRTTTENPNSKKKTNPQHTQFQTYLLPSPAQYVLKNYCTGTNHGVRTSRWER